MATGVIKPMNKIIVAACIFLDSYIEKEWVLLLNTNFRKHQA